MSRGGIAGNRKSGMTSAEQNTSGQKSSAQTVQSAGRRLVDARWSLFTVAGVLIAAVLWFELPIAFAVAGFAAVAASATLIPRNRGLRPASHIKPINRGIWTDKSMRRVVEALPDAAFIVDRRGIIRYVNGLTSERFAAIRSGERLSLGIRMPALLDALERVAEGAPAERVEWSEKVPTERWLEAYITPIAGDRGRDSAAPGTDFTLVVFRDLTDQRRLMRMRADFVANASHELRTPLASLRGFVETLQGPARDDAEAREKFLEIMNDQAARMSRLINDLLSLSRIEMREHVRPDMIVDLRDVLSHVSDALAPLADELGLKLTLELLDEPLEILGDHDELVQMFENLAQNAIKYGSEGKRVHVAAKRTDGDDGAGSIAVSIRDWGPGIPAEHLPRLTERFYRIDIATSREKQGTGLGLAIVKHILNRHRATLSIENAAEGGAIFTVAFESLVASDEAIDGEEY